MDENVVLLVDDSSEDVELILRSFKLWGVINPVQVVMDGQQAMDYLIGQGPYADRATHPFPCLVVLDLHLPDISGLSVLKWIRDQPATSDLPVVVLTGSRNREDFDKAYHQGANACVAKTLDLAELRDLIQHLNYFSLASPYNPGEVRWFPEP